MATTEPLTGARVPDQSDGPLGGLQITNAITDLAPHTIPSFANATARDAAYAAWVAAGGTMSHRLHCTVAARLLRYTGTAWQSVGNPPVVNRFSNRPGGGSGNNILGLTPISYGSASAGQIVLDAVGHLRDVDIRVDLDLYCPSTSATAGAVELFANDVALASPGTWSNRVTTTAFAARPVMATASWAGVLPAAAQNIWVRIAPEVNPAGGFWILAVDLTVVER